MKVRGKSDLRRPSVEIALDCGERITVAAPPLGAPFRALEVVPPPPAPKRLVREKGRPPQYIRDEDEPAFRAAEARANQLQLVYLFWEAVKDVPVHDGVELDTQLPEGETPNKGFVEKLEAELKASALTQADLLKVARFVSETSGASKEEAGTAVGFSEEPESDADA